MSLADEYLRRALRKGVPSLFVNLRGLYADKQQVQTFSRILNLLIDLSMLSS